jgi:predicted alpha/beta-fold hydrolase
MPSGPSGTPAVPRTPEFRPHPLLANPQIQTILAGRSPRRWLWRLRGSRMAALARFHELDCGDGVRLCGWHSPQPDGVQPRGLAVLIHGWEGSHDSNYLYSMACCLHAAGWNVFRLNLRDHGDSHHLNREMFHSARIAEVLGAVRAIQALDTARPLVVAGFSLGGNFALRVALYGPAAGVKPALSIGISPAVDPGATMRAIDNGPAVFRRYFANNWERAMLAKASAWPDRYDFSQYLPIRSIEESTARFVAEFTEYPALRDYLNAYTLTPDRLMNAPSPVAVITSKDDPVIPIAGFDGLRTEGACVAFDVTEYGGHCGFIENFAMETWTEKRVLELVRLYVQGSTDRKN